MRFYHFLFSFLLFLSVSSGYATPFSVSEEDINRQLKKQQNIKGQFGLPGLFGLSYQVLNLSTKIGQTAEKRVEVSGLLDGLFELQGKRFPAKLNLTMDIIPYYSPEKGEVYLRDIRILNRSSTDGKYEQELQTIMPFLNNNLSVLLNNIPIYTLDHSKTRDMLIKKFAKGIKVEQGRLEVETK
ncbi:hypothetical protein CFY87_03415 [Actinobacillus seminis]|uniref:Uncharacterized lipoprotein yceB n=1 Tax=Actinobacillus seminis TaxID=722 RepID=A0A263HF75_9PAST|nr:DUF1439 domain-containing protein [Actinobacillus seminis]OZN25216.1 hypothetical protein CFY87_03415 [Actinobacillus seminis]SUU36181.1 Uncharacterized lipoprotein yceB precursor [Actinobacillus seminis]